MSYWDTYFNGLDHVHEWHERADDYDLGNNRTEVICVQCGVHGERNDVTGEVVSLGGCDV